MTRGSVHFDRALAACRAIGHRYHEGWIERAAPHDAARDARDRPDPARSARRDRHRPAPERRRDDPRRRATRSTCSRTAWPRSSRARRIGTRVDVESESGCDYQPEPSASWEADADGTFRIRLRGSDRRVAINVARRPDDRRDLAAQERRRPRAGRRQPHGRHRERRRRSEPLAAHGAPSRRRHDLPIAAHGRAAEDRRSGSPPPTCPSSSRGETGTGKEVIARLIHEHSAVKRGPFVAVQLLVAAARAGREPALRPPPRRVHRRRRLVPGRHPRRRARHALPRRNRRPRSVGPAEAPALSRAHARSIRSASRARRKSRSASSRPRTPTSTSSSIRGRFRRDLFYRLGVARCSLPPLRERKDEIPALATLFLNRYARECQRTGRTARRRLHRRAAAVRLARQHPPARQRGPPRRRDGPRRRDDRQRRALAGDPAPHGTRGPWPPRAAPAVNVRLDQPLPQAIDELERAFIEHALANSGGRVAEAAQLLGLSAQRPVPETASTRHDAETGARELTFTRETPRLLLRPPHASDLDAFVEIHEDPEVMRYMTLVGPLSGRVAGWRMLAMLIGHWQLRGYGQWTVLEKAGRQVIGRVGLVESGRLARARSRLGDPPRVLGPRLRDGSRARSAPFRVRRRPRGSRDQLDSPGQRPLDPRR